MGVLIFLIFVGGIVALILSFINLHARVTRLEKQLGLGAETPTDPQPQPAGERTVQPVPIPPAAAPAPIPRVAPLTSDAKQVDDILYGPAEPHDDLPKEPAVTPAGTAAASAGGFSPIDWFKEQTLIKVGAIIFFFGAAWFVSYAIEENWVSPPLRIVLGLLLAAAVAAAGQLRATVERTQYLTLTTLSVGIVFATVAASQFAFADMTVLPPAFALLLLFGSASYAVYVSVRSNAEWLAALAGVAGFVAPLLTNAAEPAPGPLLAYVFLVAAGLSLLTAVTTWRSSILVSLVASVLYALSLLGTASDNLLWFFVVTTSALTLASTSMLLRHRERPDTLDVLSICIGTVYFVSFASAVALSPGLACFCAAAVSAGIGYAYLHRHVARGTVALFAALATSLIFIGTGFLFSGVTLALVLALEAMLALVLAVHLRLPAAVVSVAAATFALPLLVSTSLFFDSAWDTGVLHAAAATLLLIGLFLVWSAGWLLEHEWSRSTDWGSTLAATFLGGAYVFFFALSARVGDAALGEAGLAHVPVYLVLALFSALILRYVYYRARGAAWVWGSVLSLAVPTAVSVTSLAATAWNDGVWHTDAIGVWLFLALLVYHLLLSIALVYVRGLPGTGAAAVTLAYGTVAYCVLVLAVVLSALLPQELASIAQYVSYAVLLYVSVMITLWLRTPFRVSQGFLVAVALPVLLSLGSLSPSGFAAGVLSPDAVGLYVLTTLLVLLGVNVRCRTRPTAPERPAIETWSTGCLVLAGVYAFALIWMLTHTLIASSAAAVAVALFVYTVVGLGLYLFGRLHEQNEIRIAGISLLSVVVLRLVLVDVWGMELIWRTVTFLSIGLLFMAAALFERPVLARLAHTTEPSESTGFNDGRRESE